MGVCIRYSPIATIGPALVIAACALPSARIDPTQGSGQQQSSASQDSNVGFNTSTKSTTAAGGDVVQVEPIASIWLGVAGLSMTAIPLTLAVYLLGHRSKRVRALFDLAKGEAKIATKERHDET